MSKAIYWQTGSAIDFKNEENEMIEANSIKVIGKRVGIAGTNIKPGEVGTLIVDQVFKLPKDDTAIELGAMVYYDEEAEKATAEIKDVIAGYAIKATVVGDEVVLVKLLG